MLCCFGQTAQAASPHHLTMFESSRVSAQSLCRWTEWVPQAQSNQPGDRSTLLEGQEQAGLVDERATIRFYSCHREISGTLVPCSSKPLRCFRNVPSPLLLPLPSKTKMSISSCCFNCSCSALALSFASFVSWSLGGYFPYEGTNKTIFRFLFPDSVQWNWLDGSEIKLFDICLYQKVHWSTQLAVIPTIILFIFAINVEAYLKMHLKAQCIIYI